MASVFWSVSGGRHGIALAPNRRGSGQQRPVRHSEVAARASTTGLGRSTIYRLMSNGSFQRAVQLTPRAVGWPKAVIDAWLEARPKVAH
ncbi:AlpA family phage regulatory protein [Roseateles saccharophilus]|uniref:helix-turn-helix transcriptional regulator n=1 Tax=Roseateles saccharophilus TaxID=304 RepID=UPI001050EB01|nr:AlpA family phage regulatory protein [Roseateles saccharophilus]